jgi:hypothetical protein
LWKNPEITGKAGLKKYKNSGEQVIPECIRIVTNQCPFAMKAGRHWYLPKGLHKTGDDIECMYPDFMPLYILTVYRTT